MTAKEEANITVDVNDGNVVVSVPEDVDPEDITVTVDGEEVPAEIVDGKVVVDTSDLAPGNHTVEVSYPGDDKYAPFENSTVISVPLVDDYEISATGAEVFEGETATVSVEISIPVESVVVEIDGVKYLVDIVDGEGSLDVANLVAGDYPVTVTYLGDDVYTVKSNTTTVTVKAK